MDQAKAEVPSLLIGVINYELTFRRPVLKTLAGFTLMLDESSLIQNETAKRSKFILGLKPDNVILLSGTPTGGKYEKLWSQCHLLGWSISKELFYKQYIETRWVEDDGFWRQQIAGYKNVDRLKKKLADYGAVFMTTEDAGITLPEKTIIQVKTRPSPLYWRFRRERIVQVYGKELIGDTGLTNLLYSRQLCGLYNPARYEAFRDLLNSTDDRLIVFYNFTEEFENLLKICDELNRPASVINGAMKCLDSYFTFSNSVTFIQYQAGARGGNYQLANKIIYFSLPQGLELWEQSQKRIHRIGQDRPCFYYLMICPGTVEEDILSALQMRKDYNDELFRKYEEKEAP
jgi:SNF2 family DNA or RNA helicase